VAELTISLDSVETLIEIRNERMREMLFETVTFPTATAGATVAPELIATLADGGTVVTDVTFTLALHGVEKPFTVPVVITGEKGGAIQLFTPAPVIVNAADFGLEAGVAALQKVAGLQAISTAVPVTVHLVFKPL
jgi:polyisoprenoid-binding protein YceI